MVVPLGCTRVIFFVRSETTDLDPPLPPEPPDRRAYGISKQWVWLAVGGAFFVSALHISILLAEQRVGSYRQLYCGACNWQRVETVTPSPLGPPPVLVC
jgi:hypothetical protein